MDRPDPGLVYACMTHVPLWLAPPAWVTTIHLGQAQAPGRLNLRDLAPQWEQHHPVLGGTAGSFALKAYLLAERPDATRVGICQYRKFVSRRRLGGVADPRYRVMDVLPKATLQGAAFEAALDPGDARFLVSRPRRFTRLPWHRRGYLREYARDHVVEDFLRFTAEAVEQGALERREVLAFFNEDVLVPGGVELGVFPADFWLEQIGRVERVVQACLARHPVAREGYQTRVWSFCAERLGSYLLIKHLRAISGGGWLARHVEPLGRCAWSRRHCGQLNLVVEGEVHAGYAGGT